MRIDPLLGFLQVELALDMPGLVSRAAARASRSVLLDLFIDLDEASRRFSEAVIMGLERSPYGPSPTIPATGCPTSRRTAPFRRALPFSDRRCEASSPKNRRMSSRLLDAVDASSGSASSSTDRTARNNGCSRTLPAYSPRTPPTAAATSALGDASAPRGCGHSPDPGRAPDEPGGGNSPASSSPSLSSSGSGQLRPPFFALARYSLTVPTATRSAFAIMR